MAAGAIPPFTLNFLRWALALVILYPFVARRLCEDWPLVRTHLRLLTVTSFLSITLYNALQYLALITSSLINIALITASAGPIFTLLIGWRLFQRRHQSPGSAGCRIVHRGRCVGPAPG